MKRLAVCLTCLGLGACAQVQPWERGDLARPEMAANPLPEQRALREHIQVSREAGDTTATPRGPGCGCY